MKKHIPMIAISSLTIAALYFAIFSLTPCTFSEQNKQVRIAIFTPATHPALEEVEQGFKETVQAADSQPYAFTTFNANGNRTLLRAQAEEIVTGHYDLLFTIGAHCSQTVAELLAKKGIQTPHIFGAVDGQELAQSLRASNESTTGVYVQVDYKKEMDILHQCKPEAKNILLVYDPTHGTGLEKYKKEIAAYIKKFGATLHAVEIYQTNEIQQKVTGFLPSMDVVLVLIDNTVVGGIDALITLCNRYGVTLCASDLASGKKGAALAYGITEYESGKSAAQKAIDILKHGKQPQGVPASPITHFRTAINQQTMHAQNLNVDNALLQNSEEQQ